MSDGQRYINLYLFISPSSSNYLLIDSSWRAVASVYQGILPKGMAKTVYNKCKVPELTTKTKRLVQSMNR